MEKFRLSEMENKNFSKAVNEIYLLTDYNNNQYPEYYKWFFGKSIPRIFDKSGDIIFYFDGFEVLGLTILKKTIDERKICTFMINDEYRKKGYSKLLLEDAFLYLGTEKPLITIPEVRLNEFSNIINTYNWNETNRTDEYFSNEVIFNGSSRKLEKR